MCGNRFRGSIGNDEALSVVDPTDVRVGLSITPRLTRETNLRFALDLHHLPIETGTRVYGLTGIEPSKLLHGGVELFFGNPLLLPPTSFRAGYSQGFFTAGASLNVPFFSVEFATYGRDVSSDESPKPDRRYLASVSSDF